MSDFDPRKQCLYDPDWQAIRMECKGLWGTRGGARAAVTILAQYVHDQNFTITSYWRTLNLLNAVRMGYHGQGLVNSDMDKTVRAMQAIASTNYKHKIKKITHGKGSPKFDVLSDAETLRRWRVLDVEVQHAIKLDLRKRWDSHPNHKTRAELYHFLEVVGGLD